VGGVIASAWGRIVATGLCGDGWAMRYRWRVDVPGAAQRSSCDGGRMLRTTGVMSGRPIGDATLCKRSSGRAPSFLLNFYRQAGSMAPGASSRGWSALRQGTCRMPANPRRADIQTACNGLIVKYGAGTVSPVKKEEKRLGANVQQSV